ncbi:MAG: hypothetical protein OEX04_18310 [Acidimicrobiia bacterium]|nr:hypothetical protein [Acidimicrobiia bacterium]MDH4309428.1 hypothetical protein [Acidimicrobiia bacterium]MDH5293576.1 hypothetical protein [Acidimicrobiia bacterium]
MKLFVATDNGQDDGDFSFTVPGELVHLPLVVCDCPDCGCERAMSGLASHKGTTSFTVREIDLDRDRFAELLRESLNSAGWTTLEEDDGWVKEFAEEHIAAAAPFPHEATLRLREGAVELV